LHFEGFIIFFADEQQLADVVDLPEFGDKTLLELLRYSVEEVSYEI
jgi:hypothetical protein